MSNFMPPETKNYRNIAYRFGYSIDQDAFVGHINFGDEKKTFTFEKENSAECESSIHTQIDEELTKQTGGTPRE